MLLCIYLFPKLHSKGVKWECAKMVVNRREFTRKSLDCTVSVFDDASNEYLGLMVDVSEKGFLLSSTVECVLGALYQFKAVFVDDIAEDRQEVTVVARCAWVDSISHNMQAAGFEIDEVPAHWLIFRAALQIN